ncbi:MAG: DUF4124 domain-containing protein [Steroidobacteraceae bacterium]
MRKHLVLPALILAGGLLAQTVQADVYRWTDAQGRVQYSDRPVPGAVRVDANAKTRLPGSNDAAAAAETERLRKSQADSQAQQGKDATIQTVQQDVAVVRAEQCKQARELYEKSLRARRIFKTNANGERQYLSDAEADTQRVSAKSNLDEACGPQ